MRKERTPRSTSGGVLALVFWLVVGFGFTEFTAIALNAWLLNNPHARSPETVAAAQAGLRD